MDRIHSLEKLTEMIKERLIQEDLLKDPIVTVQFLNYKVSVMGEVARPGTYALSSFSTVFHALYKAGGISRLGSLRNIKE